MTIQFAEALEIIGGLSQPSKMPWYGWSTSARNCITGSKLAQVEGTVCSGCYALRGRYNFPRVQAALARRDEAWKDPRFVDAFVIVLNHLHRRTKKRLKDGRIEDRMRWFDSGDLQSVEMLDKIVAIATATPQIRHWLPTREWNIVRGYAKPLPENLVLRLSVARVGVALQRQPLGLPFATVGCDDDEELHQCPALTRQGNRCLDCDACWTSANINYREH